jgi:hypothetical protein
MRSFATRAQLRSWGAELSLQERASVRKSASQGISERATFLSHSSKDQDLVVGASRILNNHGAIVYTDEKDPSLPPYTNKDTASLLKKRIQQAGKFVLLASDNSKESKWVPWELGNADGYKAISKIALFPAVDEGKSNAWTQWEYMGLYSKIIWSDLQGQPKPLWIVLDETANTGVPLNRWLSS